MRAPTVSPSSAEIVAAASVAAPARSSGSLARRGVSRNTRKARPSASNDSGTWAMKMDRQPKASTTGPPATSPMTGAPAPTNDHHPIALTRSSSGNACMISAIDAGPIAAPGSDPIVRIAMSEGPFHANAVQAAPIVNPAKPSR